MTILETKDLNAWFGAFHAVKSINYKAKKNQVHALIGPSGCGKSTFLRCLNRLHEETSGTKISGQVFLDGTPIYGLTVDPVLIRRRIGMVFQKPNAFPGLSIFENVAAGLRLAGVRKFSVLEEAVVRALEMSALWNEVKDKIHKPGTSLSGGQQQRLCIARSLAIQPDVLLMDEPTSALDPISTARIEELCLELKKQVTILIVTHNMQQAARISDTTSFFLNGECIESGPTSRIFTNPEDRRTEEYITGRFG
jgi:phosphate transport system ATP-binding protein